MYFDLKPKTQREDLFGADYALASLKRGLVDTSTRMIVIKGLRRAGKTSLMNVALNECGGNFVKIDVRDSPFYDRKEFLAYLIKSIEQKIGTPLLEKIIASINRIGVKYKELSLEVFLSREENLAFFFDKLNRNLQKKLILAFDEVQFLKQIKFDYVLASIFDNYGQLKIVLTGSEIGLLDSFLGKNDYDSPLYGRAVLEIQVNKLNAEDTNKFLEAGFKQIGKSISFPEISEVIEQLDGIIGWSTYYGWLRAKGNSHLSALTKVKEEGKETVKRELEHFLDKRKAQAKYMKILQLLSKGENTWSAMRNSLLKKRIKISESQLHLYLKELADYGFIEKIAEKYYISDPVLLQAV